MTETYPILEKIVSCINEDLGLEAFCKAIKAYDNKSLPIPIQSTYFTVAAEENKSAFFENDSSELCENNTITIRINCFAPLRRIPYMSHGFAEIVMDYLCDEFAPNVVSCSIGNTEYDSEVKAFKISCFLTLRYELCAGENSGNSDLATASGLFCKSHLTNESIHLSEEDRTFLDAHKTDTDGHVSDSDRSFLDTHPSNSSIHVSTSDRTFLNTHPSDTDAHVSAADRTFLNSPCVIGTYTGTGNDLTQTITLGFRPKAVIVFRNNFHAASYMADENSSRCYFGISIGNYTLKALTITSTGFTVSTVSTSNATTYLNELNGKHVYIAFR
ncbi:MAG: hypothetical protein IJ491_00195 [Clostridia bacterium]|nr:hypothetical protein [Clostridia bacterium]